MAAENVADQMLRQMQQQQEKENKDKMKSNVVRPVETMGIEGNGGEGAGAPPVARGKSGFIDNIRGAIGFDAFFGGPDKQKQLEQDIKSGKRGRASVFNRESVDRKAPTSDEEAAMNEHAWGDVSLCTTPEGMLDHGLGKGVMWYFKFCLTIIKLNVVLTVCASISLFSSLGAGPKYEGAPVKFPGVFYLSTYDKSVYPAYVISVTLMLICVFGFGPYYRWYVVDWNKKQRELRDRAAAEGRDVKYVEDMYDGQYGRAVYDYVDEDAVDLIHYEGFKLKTAYSRLGVAFSYFTMAVILTLSGVITFYMQRATRKSGGEGAAAAVIAIFVAAMGLAWEKICDKLTQLEYLAYWSLYWKSSCVKVLLFKILNIVTVFLVKRIEFQGDSGEEGQCQLRDLGNQFLFLMLFNTLASVGITVLVKYAPEEEERTEFGFKEFIVSTEYVELVYRQFIIGLGFNVVPMISLFGLCANTMEYWLDKYRMLRICNKPQATSSTFSGVLAFYSFLSAIFVMFSFPNGSIFILAGSFGLKDDCYVYQ